VGERCSNSSGLTLELVASLAAYNRAPLPVILAAIAEAAPTREALVPGCNRDLDLSGFEEVERPDGAFTPHHELEPIEDPRRFLERGENQLEGDRRRQRDAERNSSAFSHSGSERLRRGGALEASGQYRQHAMAEIGEVCLRPSRRKSSPPSSPSSSLIARDSEGCATPHSSAARVKLSARATERKYRT
jgi:hypothetical protein